MAKGKAKLCQPPMRASPRLVALWSNTTVQIPTPTPDVPVKEAVTSTLPPKKRQNFRMAGESSSRRDIRTPCRQSRRLAALYSVTQLVSEEKVVIEISDDSVQKEDTDLEQNEAVLVAGVGGEWTSLRMMCMTHSGQCWMPSQTMKLKRCPGNGISTAHF
ncbi:hypothetical protein PIB30_089164 [Stylosanthes scabra]|uniref:Uncharacterized protein n=1 Tax=Stylosanthes scabra TaxID=79078 RepID=A0ABU6QUM5_9FABA|nr:hypothetical protein [Stylosanthes scabra]